jgi:hypothetical protein
MPRISDQLQHSIVFLYPSEEAARAGTGAGGTGFVVAFRANDHAEPFHYLLTNVHVAKGGNCALRVNLVGGGVDILALPSGVWTGHPHGDDIAACAVSPQPSWALTALDWNDCAMTKKRMTEFNIGVGDEVFMLGRFVSHDGLHLNEPLARFGNIAMMPGLPVKDGRGISVEAFLVEMRSLSGFSGSPVFVYMGPGTYRGNGTMMPFYKEAMGLMGIDTGHKTTMARPRNRNNGVDSDLEVAINTGISIVSPAWKIDELLETGTLASDREALLRRPLT